MDFGLLHDPNYLKKLSIEEMEKLAGEIRRFLIESVSKTGGHLSSNLGVVELTIALHYAFNSPIDKIFFDVGHQCYVHKILNGRRNELKTIHDELTGSWEIPNKQRYSYYNIAVNKVYGTKELNALHIIEKTLNMRTIQITKEIIQGGKKKRVVDQEQTMLALEKQRLLVEKFQSFRSFNYAQSMPIPTPR